MAMKKLKLELDALTVESFASLPDRPTGIGTVRGRGNPGSTEPRLCWTGHEPCTLYDCPMWPLTADPYNPCNTDEVSCGSDC
jgi:hypothetical protein